MDDREKVINQIEVDIQRAERTGEMLVYVGLKTAKDAIALLKEQDAKRGKWVKQLSSCPSAIAVGGSRTSACTTCGGWGRKTFKYCPHCGAKMEKQEVKADD